MSVALQFLQHFPSPARLLFILNTAHIVSNESLFLNFDLILVTYENILSTKALLNGNTRVFNTIWKSSAKHFTLAALQSFPKTSGYLP